MAVGLVVDDLLQLALASALHAPAGSRTGTRDALQGAAPDRQYLHAFAACGGFET
jgi:hypothetical protein